MSAEDEQDDLGPRQGRSLDKEEIQKILPHRPPFLFVDRVRCLIPGVKTIAYWDIKEEESFPFFQGHFPGNPVTPGVLIVEALAQAGALAVLSLPEAEGKTPFFARVNGVKWKQPVLPGSSVKLKVKMLNFRGPVGKGQGIALVDGAEVCTVEEMIFALR